MLRVVRILAILALQAHVVLGCCFHHAHATRAGSDSNLIQLAGDACGCGTHLEPPSQPPADSDHDPHGHCEQGDCVFLAPGDSSCARLPLPAGCLGAILPPIDAPGSVILRLTASGMLLDTFAGYPRLHLVHRVLLI